MLTWTIFSPEETEKRARDFADMIYRHAPSLTYLSLGREDFGVVVADAYEAMGVRGYDSEMDEEDMTG